MTQKNLIEWGSKFEIDPRVDEAHKRLVGSINDLHKAMSEGKGKDVLGKILKDLQLYVISHFRSEENLMRQNNFPGLIPHANKHKEFENKIKAYVDDFENGNIAILPMELVQFLKTWISDHILKQDMQYKSYLK